MNSETIVVGTTVEIEGIKYTVIRLSKAVSIVREKEPAWVGGQNNLMQFFVKQVTENESQVYFCTEEWAVLRKKETGTVYSLNLLWRVQTIEEFIQEKENVTRPETNRPGTGTSECSNSDSLPAPTQNQELLTSSDQGVEPSGSSATEVQS